MVPGFRTRTELHDGEYPGDQSPPWCQLVLPGQELIPAQTLPIESLFSVFENPQVLALCAPNKMSRVNEIEVFGNELLVTE